MSLLWNLIVDEEVIRWFHREIKRSEIIVDIERKINVPLLSSPSDEIRQKIKEVLNSYSQEISNFRQEIHEEISRSQVEFGNNLRNNNYLKGIDGRIQKLEENIGKQTESAPPPTVDLIPIQNAIKQLEEKQQLMESSILSEIEARLNAYQPVITPADNYITVLQKQIDSQKLEIETLKKDLLTLTSSFDTLSRENITLKQKVSQQEQLLANRENTVQTVEALKKDLLTLKSSFDTLSRENVTLKQKVSQQEMLLANRENTVQTVEALKKDLLTLTSSFDTLSRENITLKQKVSQQEQLLINLQNQNTVQSRESIEPKRQFESPQKKSDSIVGKTVDKSKKNHIVNISAVSILSKSWIKFFSLPKSKSPEAFFHGDKMAVKEKLAQSIQHMDGLITALNQSKIAETTRTSFIKNLRYCMNALEKLYNKFKFDSYDPEEISEKITEKFFKIISENLLDNVMVAIYRGGKNAVGYQEFLQEINRYLSMHGIYTEDIMPGEKMEDAILSNIDPPITKKTSVATDDDKIDEVELLPYFMFYENDDGKLDTVRKRGRVVALKYGA